MTMNWCTYQVMISIYLDYRLPVNIRFYNHTKAIVFLHTVHTVHTVHCTLVLNGM